MAADGDGLQVVDQGLEVLVADGADGPGEVVSSATATAGAGEESHGRR